MLDAPRVNKELMHSQLLARPTCVLIELYRVAPQSGAYSIWVLMPHRYRDDVDRFIKCYWTLWFWLLECGRRRRRWWWRVWIRIPSCKQLLATLHMFSLVMSVVLELHRMPRNIFKISCRGAQINSVCDLSQWMLAGGRTCSDAKRHQELASHLTRSWY